jgi:hypothetical protein
MPHPAEWAVLPALVLAISCGAGTLDPFGPAPEPQVATRVDGGDPVGGSMGDAIDGGAGATCQGSPLHVYDDSPGVLNQLWVGLPSGSTTAPFVVDMGSPISYWAGPPLPDGGMDISPDGGTTTISCETRGLPTLRGVTLELEPGVPAAGALGVDLVRAGAALDLRITDGLFVWWQTPPPAPPGGTTVPLSLQTIPGAYNRLVASGVRLDGKEVRLILDTGSPHVVLLSSTPRPGETRVPGEDGNGEQLTLYTSTIQISFGDGPTRTVPVDRAARFPTLEQTIGAIGPDVVGILGLSALGHERIVIARDLLTFVP